MNANDVLVRHLTGEQQLALESFFDVRCRARVRHHFGTDHLDRHRDAQFVVPRLIDRAHAADAEEPDDAIAVAELLSDGERTARARACFAEWLRETRGVFGISRVTV